MHNNLHRSPLHEDDGGDCAARMSQFAKQDKIQQTDTPTYVAESPPDPAPAFMRGRTIHEANLDGASIHRQ